MSVKESTRELFARWESLNFEEKRSLMKARRAAAAEYLKKIIRPGSRIRATKSECCAHEASFTVFEWRGDTIVSLGDREISPAMVYSVDGEVVRF